MNPKHGGKQVARLFSFGSLAVTVFLCACGTSTVGSNQGADGGSGGNGSGGSAATGGSGGAAMGGAGGSADPCADCEMLDHCCLLVALDGCNSAGGCVAASGSQQQAVAARCRTDLNSFITTLPSQAMACGATSGGNGTTPDGGASDTNGGGSGGTSGGGTGGASGGTVDGGACPAQEPSPTVQGGVFVFPSCSNANQTCDYPGNHSFCECKPMSGADAGSALVWNCETVI
ncbi:MAG TPA: hypothetical protein VH374_22785 [Polyangia bacterium]|nr:hypothetical protein [Polyangia bacterium]